MCSIFARTHMAGLNYKHLHYFWTVAKCGSIARASEQLQKRHAADY